MTTEAMGRAGWADAYRPSTTFRHSRAGGPRTVAYSRTPSEGENYSHSIVPGGLLVTSYTTRFTPFTSLMMRVAVSPRNFMSNW
ncbi:hypothetical protein ABIB68_000494 [Bradyrhizobium sp. F1.2.2]